MIFLIPTAKEMNLDKLDQAHQLPDKGKVILDSLCQLSLEDLAKAYKLKPVAAQIEQERLLAIQEGKAQAKPAVQLFNGLMYRQIDRDFSPADLDFLSQQVFITSSLYGIINALDPIAPHRLDFHTKVRPQGQSLRSYWQETYGEFAKEQAPIISLLSSEFEEVFPGQMAELFIKLVFHEEKAGQLKTHSTISKKARGKLLNLVIKEKVTDLDQLKQLTFDDFHYQKELSDSKKLVFVKKLDP